MRRATILVVVSGAVLLGAAGTAEAKGGGLTRADVEARGWVCFPGDVMVHCVHPNTTEALPPSLPSLNFSLSDGAFLGTENLIRADLGSDDRPCPQGTEEDGTYEPVDFTGDGLPEYFSCHHNNQL